MAGSGIAVPQVFTSILSVVPPPFHLLAYFPMEGLRLRVISESWIFTTSKCDFIDPVLGYPPPYTNGGFVSCQVQGCPDRWKVAHAARARCVSDHHWNMLLAQHL